MKLTIPIGSQILQTNNKTIEIQIQHTPFWILGEQKPSKLWDAYIYNPQTQYKEILRKNKTTKSFALFSNIILKTPFPFKGKDTENSPIIIKFIKKITKQKHARTSKKNTNTKSRKLQTNSKRRSKNAINLS